MTDVAIVAAVALVSAAAVAIVWLRQRAAALIRAEQRDERDNGVVARLRGRMDEIEAQFAAARTEQKTFLANARQR